MCDWLIMPKTNIIEPTKSVQSRIDKEGVIFYPLFTDLGVIW